MIDSPVPTQTITKPLHVAVASPDDPDLSLTKSSPSKSAQAPAMVSEGALTDGETETNVIRTSPAHKNASTQSSREHCESANQATEHTPTQLPECRITVMLNLSGEVLFAFDWRKKLPVLIDTGASVSIIPAHFCEEYDTDQPIALCGFVGSSRTVGSITYVPEIGFQTRSPQKFYVANVDLNFAILGMDFLTKNELTIRPHLQSLTHERTGENVQLTKGVGSNPEETFWQNFLSQAPIAPLVTVMTAVASATSSPIDIVDLCLKVIRRFPQILCAPDYTVPKHNYELDIEVFPGFKFHVCNPRKCSMFNQEIIDKQFTELVHVKALIRKSSCNTSPITLATKKDGSIRVCVDYTILNNQTVPLHYPLPLIQSLDQRLTNKHRFFSTLDLKNAFYSLPLTKRAQELAAITTLHGVYQPLRTPFGLKNAPAKFAELIADVINGLETFVFAYLDDFLVYSETLGDHLKHLALLCERFEKFGLYLNLDKCQFGQNSIEFLGHQISDQGMKPLTSKVSAIMASKRPTTLRELRSFLGSVNYYRKYVPHIAEILAPLNSLLQGPKKGKNSKLSWEKQHDAAFNRAISALAHATCLTYEDPTLPLVLSTDASTEAAGAVLEQNFGSDEAPSFRPLSFFSKTFPSTTALRSTFNRELTAMYLAMKYFRHRILGRPLIIRTDHIALVRAMTNRGGEHSPNEVRMLAYCKEFSPQMVYIAGEANVVADWLSRPPSLDDPAARPPCSPVDIPKEPPDDHAPAITTSPVDIPMETPNQLIDDSAITCIPNHKVCLVTNELDPNEALNPETFQLIQQQEVSLIDRVHQASLQNNSGFSMVSRNLSENPQRFIYGVKDTGSDVFRPIVPTKLRIPIFHKFHSTAHLGADKTCELVSAHYYWPEMVKDITLWCRACGKCQSCKISRHNRASLVNYPGNNERLQVLHLDVVTLTPSDGNRYVLTMRDRGTGLICAAPLRDKTAESVKNAFLTHYIGHYGVPATVITDNGREFNSALFRDFCTCCGIHQKFITAYHPQANGAIERVHRCLRSAFRALPDPNQWVTQLPFLVLTLNNVTCDINHYSAFQHTFGQPANLPGTMLFPSDITTSPQVDWFQTAAFAEIMSHHHRDARPLPNNRPYREVALDTCSRVWVRNNAPDNSLSPLYKGPFDVVARHDKYFTIDCAGRLDNVSVDRLKAFYELPEEFPTTYPPDHPYIPNPDHPNVDPGLSHPYDTRRAPPPDYVAMNG